MMRITPQRATVVILAASYAILFTFLTFRLQDSFNTYAFDLGNMDQAAWNTIHGRILAFTNMEGVSTRLGIHCEPTLILVSTIYWLWSNPKALLLLQTLALASGAIPVYAVARMELKGRWAPVALAASYLLFPSLEAVNLSEFHTVALSAPLLLWAFYFAMTDRWAVYAVASALAAGTKEEVGLDVAMIGLYLAATRRNWRPAVVAVAGIAWSMIAILVVIPAFNPHNSSPYTGYYAYLGHDIPHVVLTLVTHPWIPVACMVTGTGPAYMNSLLAPVGFLSLLSPERLLLGLPSLLINILSDDGNMARVNTFHYTAPIIPAIMVAAITGARRASAVLGTRRPLAAMAETVVMVVLLASSMVYHRLEGFTPLSVRFSVPAITAHDMVGYQVLKAVPADASLSVQDALNPHVSEREKLYIFPRVDDAEYVLADQLRDSNSSDPEKPSMKHRYELRILDDLMKSGDFDVVLKMDGYVLLKRKNGAPTFWRPG